MIQILIFDSTLVPGDIELVNVGLRTQTPELEVHLRGVLAGADHGEGVIHLAAQLQVGPAVPGNIQHAAVQRERGGETHCCYANTRVNYIPCVVVSPLTVRPSITKSIFHLNVEEPYNLQ